MPSLLSRVVLTALAGSGGHPRRRLVQDASLTPCTHDICGHRTLAEPEYTADSAVPRAATWADGDKLMDLKATVYNHQENDAATGSIVRSGKNLVVSVKFPSMTSFQMHKCVLGVEVVHDTGMSDATLQHSPNEYKADDPLEGTYTGATTLAVPVTSPNCDNTLPSGAENACVDANYTNSMSVTVSPSSFPLRYEDNFGAKLHAGRLGVTLNPYLKCTGFGVNTQKSKKIYLPNLALTPNTNPWETAPEHKIYYDLVAKGDTLTSKDEAGTIQGELKASSTEKAKRLYNYSAAFVHFHDQVRFPNASIAGKTHNDHFDGASAALQDAICEWDHGELHDDLNASRTNLETNVWMTPNDAAKPEQAYGDWTADDCVAGICSKYRKYATVASADAYLPFDKPLTDYYKTDKLPKVMCKSQKGGTTEGTAVSSDIAPEIAGDDAAPIFSGVVTKFTTVTSEVCSPTTAGICDVTEDTMKVKGQIFNFVRYTQDFTNLLTDHYDFRATYTCVSSITGNSDLCTIADGTDSEIKLLTTLKRTDAGADLTAQLDAKAQAVEDIEFTIPQKYGTTFDNFQLTLSGESRSDSTQQYRASGDFRVNTQLLDREATAGQESVQWTGGEEIAVKEFEGYNTQNRFVTRAPAIITQQRVKQSFLTTFYKNNPLFDATVVGNDTVGIMSPFVAIADIADTAATATGADDNVGAAMSNGNKYVAVKSFCCGVDSYTESGSTVDCTELRVSAEGKHDASDASVYCRTNGFDAVRCLSSTLDVQYTVKTQSLDNRYLESEVVATKTYTFDAIASLPQADQNFTVRNGAFNAVTVGAGVQAGDNTFTYTINSKFMGSASDVFSRDADADVIVDRMYNCETAGREVKYRTSLSTPCGESDRNEAGFPEYEFEAEVTAHYVYTDGGATTVDQVKQKATTATIAGKTRANGAVSKDEAGAHFETEEWRVQDSSDPDSEAKGSGTPIQLKVVLSNDNNVANYNAALHMPADKVFIDPATLSVTAGPGNVTLHECKTENAETFCILHYTNDDVMSIDAGKYCGDLGDDGQVGGENGNADQPACPVISYKVAARVMDGGHANGFGHGAACGVPTGEVPLTHIGDTRTHTLFVYGNDRAYDGVLDIHVVEKDENCERYCSGPSSGNYTGQQCYNPNVAPSGTPEGWLMPEVNNLGSVQTYCRNPHPMAEEDIHNVAVPGRNGAAQTNLNPGALGAMATSKDLTFEVRYFQIGRGARRYTIQGLTENVPAGLPTPRVCSSTSYQEQEGCVRSSLTDDDSDAKVQSAAGNGCKNNEEDCAEEEDQMIISSFYLALGSDPTQDVCANTNVGNDPYTLADGTLTLGFSIKVEYLTNVDATATGTPDDGVEHKFYFKLQCPQKAYSMNLVQVPGDDAAAPRKNIAANVDIGLVDKNLYAESHFKFLEVLGYFAGRSTKLYDAKNNRNYECIHLGSYAKYVEANPDAECHKAAIKIKGNPSVQFKGAVTEIFLDQADEFSEAAPIEFEFTNPCLFTSITLISKTTPFAEDGTFIQGTAGDTEFSFRVQCPRWREDAASDSLVLHYDVKNTSFSVQGGGVTVTQPNLDQADMVNPFTSITTSLKKDLCQGDIADAECTFDYNADSAPYDVTLEKTGSQQEWLNYLSSTCGFTVDSQNGNYVGFMERVYQRQDLNRGVDGTESQTYCSGRKLSFGIQTQGTHTATIRVDAPLEMDFAIQIDKLEWATDGCDADQYKLVAEATLYRRQYTGLQTKQPWRVATQSFFTDVTRGTDDFFGTPTVAHSNGKMTITGICQNLDDSKNADGTDSGANNCAEFEREREIDFGAVYTQFGVDYRASLGIDMQMSCPRGTKHLSDSGGVSLQHQTECNNYGDSADFFSTCPVDNTDNLFYVGASGQIRLTLKILDTAFTDHIVHPPTYKVTSGTIAEGKPDTGTVESLCNAQETDCMFRANNGQDDIGLVTSREYPYGEQRPPEENSVVTLRGLPLSDTTISITWIVDRVLNSTARRRLRVAYSLGAAATKGADSVGFKVLPATREEDAGIAVGAGTEEVAEGAHTTERSGTSHAEEKKEEDSSMLVTLFIVASVIAGGVLLVVVFMRKADQKKNGTNNTPAEGSSINFKSRFYQYARLDKGEAEHVENLWKRNRFNTGNSRFL